MRHLFTGRVRAVLVASVLIAIVLAVAGSLIGLAFPQQVVQGVLAPFRAGASKLMDGSQQLYNYIFKYESLQAENESLKEQLAAIEDEARDAYATKQENERLKAALGLKEAHEDYELVDAYIISTSSGDWSRTFTINRGTNVGIQKDMCAVTAYGEIVGIVSEVGVNYAVVKTAMLFGSLLAIILVGAAFIADGLSVEVTRVEKTRPDQIRVRKADNEEV